MQRRKEDKQGGKGRETKSCLEFMSLDRTSQDNVKQWRTALLSSIFFCLVAFNFSVKNKYYDAT